MMQRSIVGIALDLLEIARQPRTTVQTPFYWDTTGEWRGTYNADSSKFREVWTVHVKK